MPDRRSSRVSEQRKPYPKPEGTDERVIAELDREIIVERKKKLKEKKQAKIAKRLNEVEMTSLEEFDEEGEEMDDTEGGMDVHKEGETVGDEWWEESM